MHRLARSALAVTTTAAALAGLGACGADAPAGTPVDTPSAPAPVETVAAAPVPAAATPVAEPSVAVTPTPPDRPTLPAAAFTEDDAIAFAGHYLRVLTHARATGDSNAVREISEPDCHACDYDARLIDAAVEQGITFENDRMSFRSARIEAWDTEQKAVEIMLEMHATASQLVNADGSIHQETPETNFSGLMQLKYHDARWWVWEMPS
ncbi:DUF6318 family protein [Kineococcus gypseus]|uniref:DUF6318 family protein n=1 Tax=Kineococcus gypseus TaxID=1637102 RepID=UPI003D7DA9AB